MNEFVMCVLDNKPPSVGGADGKISVAMGYAALESIQSGRFVKIKRD